MEAHATMDIDVITSFNQQYWTTIGQDCVISWQRHWPEPLQLTCYVEDFVMPTQPRCRTRNWEVLGQRYQDFQLSDQRPRVKTFAKKAYCIMTHWRNSSADRMIWIDADVITYQDVPLRFLESVCSNSDVISYMGVNHDYQGRRYHSAESGVFAVNLRHPLFDDFARAYEQRYDQHQSQDLRRFYDGEVLGAVCQQFQNTGAVRDICANLGKDYKTPIRHTIWGQYLHHHKSKHSKEDWTNQVCQ
jgi:hypothetical protein